jgi:hypothetical protein
MRETLGEEWMLTFEPRERKRRVDYGGIRVECRSLGKSHTKNDK